MLLAEALLGLVMLKEVMQGHDMLERLLQIKVSCSIMKTTER